MADKPPVESKDAIKDALPASRPRPAGNPAFRMMGKLPTAAALLDQHFNRGQGYQIFALDFLPATGSYSFL